MKKLITLLNLLVAASQIFAQQKQMLFRIAEIEIYPEYVTNYHAILKEEAAASVKLEAGVIAIFPMFKNNDSTQVRILEIYASNEAYLQHLKTPHFIKYKTNTQKMVKTLQLADMNAIDKETIADIFKKQSN